MPPRGWRKAKHGKMLARKPASQLGADGPPTTVDLDAIEEPFKFEPKSRRPVVVMADNSTWLIARDLLLELVRQKGANEVFAAQAWMLARAFKKEAESGERDGE